MVMELSDRLRFERRRRRRPRLRATPRGTAAAHGAAHVQYVLHPRWIAVPFVLGLVGIATRQPALVLAGGTLVLALALTLCWGARALHAVECRRELGSGAAHWGDEVTLHLDITNRKLLPLPWLECLDGFPAALELVRGGTAVRGRRRDELRTLLTLRPYERVVRRYTVRCLTRGEHTFGPTTLRAGDLFGLSVRAVEIDQPSHLLVYPRLVELEHLGLPATYPLGDRRASQALHRSPLDLAGVRPYQQGDTLRQVHWRATARAGALQVKVHEPETGLRALILLNAETTDRIRAGFQEELLEPALSVAASLAAHLVLGRWEVGLAANAQSPRQAGLLRVPPGAGASQLDAVLGALARVDASTTVPFAGMAGKERMALRAGTTVIAISTVLPDSLLDALRGYAIYGHPVSLLLVGDGLSRVTAQETGLPTRWLDVEAGWAAAGLTQAVDRSARPVAGAVVNVGGGLPPC
jgi:uncharacterized protein (DUF58 family)